MPPYYRGILAGWLVLLAVVTPGCKEDSPIEPSPPPCTYTLSTSSLTFGAAGGSGSVTVSTDASCTWTASAESNWLSISSGASGTGAGVVSVSAALNPATSARTGALRIAGQSVSASQEGQQLPACTYEIAPASAPFGKEGGTGSFAVSTPSHCQWTAASSAAWLVVTAGAQGTGNGTVNYSVSRNSDTTDRGGAIAVADRVFSVTQPGDIDACQYSVAPVEFSPCMSFPGQLMSTITTQPGCPWTASPDVSWITLTNGQSGSGSGAISFNVLDNWDPPRLGIVMVRWPTPTQGQNLRISQAGCYYAVSNDAFSFTSAGGTATFDVLQISEPNTCGGPLQNACLWTAQSDASWITVTTSMPRRGDERVSFSVAPNGGAARTGTIVVRDKVVRITQAGG
jgi:hypothetical protein